MATDPLVKPLTAFGYVIFDVVGTLIDFEGAITAGLQAIATCADVTIDPEALRFPDDLGRCHGRIAAALGLPDTPENRAFMIETVGRAQPFPDSAEAMARLGRHYRLIAMTNARRWAFLTYEASLGHPFRASFTTDETGTEKPDPAFFHQVFAHVEAAGGHKDDILHTAQSQHPDIGISRAPGMTNAWIRRRHAQPGYGGTIEPQEFTRPDYHFHALIEQAEAADRAFQK